MSERVLAWNDPTLEAAETAACPCGHASLDHEWHGCEECACTKSAIHALLTSDWYVEKHERSSAHEPV